MITTDFAPNESTRDATLAFKLLCHPWKWRRGKEINNLKRRLKSRYFSRDTHISLFFTGRAALHQYLKTLNLQTDDKVLVQAFTCEAVILPIIEQNVKPAYVDINKEDYSMDLSDLKKKITDKTKVLVLQHTFGITPKKRKEILALAKKNKIDVIEDIAHGFNIKLFKRKRFQSAILMSFGRSKAFSSVFGGTIAVRGKRNTQNMREAEKNLPNPHIRYHIQMVLYKISTVIIKATYHLYIGKILHFILKNLNLLVPEISKKEKKGEFDSNILRTYPNIAAIFMHAQLDRFNDVVKQRKKVVRYYNAHLPDNNHSYKNPLIRYPFLTANKKKILQECKKKDIFLGNWYSQVVAPQELDLMRVGYKKGSCPTAEKLTEQVINLPTSIDLHDAKRIVKIIKKFT